MVKFYCINKSRAPINRKRLKVFLENLFNREGCLLNRITYVFCNDEYLLKINAEFLSHNYYTDIITFDLSEEKGGIIGEVYISSDRVLENSKVHNVSFEQEMLRVMFHGALHLIGYNDKTTTQKKLMRKAEDKYLKRWKKEVSRET